MTADNQSFIRILQGQIIIQVEDRVQTDE